MQIPPWIGLTSMGVAIVVAMIVDGQKNGMLATGKDWSEFSFFLLSLVGLAAISYWLSAFIHSESRVATTAALTFEGALLVKVVLDLVNRLTQARRLSRRGSFTKRQFAKRVAPDGSVEQISAIIHEQGQPPSLVTGMRKAACALFLVCLDEAGDDVKKIDELNASLNSFLDNYDTPA